MNQEKKLAQERYHPADIIVHISGSATPSLFLKRMIQVVQVVNGLRALEEMERYAKIDEELGSDKRLPEKVLPCISYEFIFCQ